MQTLTPDAGRAEVRLGDKADFVDIRAEDDGLLVIQVVGAPDSSKVYEGMHQGYVDGWIHAAMPTLVDVSDFHGSIDWASIKSVSQLTDWGKKGAPPSRVAYLSGDPFFALVIKAVSILFKHSTHRLFSDRQTALAWLRDPRPDALAS